MLYETWFKTDLNTLPQIQAVRGAMFSQDNMANRVGTAVTQGGMDAELSGTVFGYVLRPDGNTVAVAGMHNGNRAWIDLPESAYAIPGQIQIIVQLANGQAKTTLCACTAYVQRSSTDTYIDPGQLLPGIPDLLTQLNNKLDSPDTAGANGQVLTCDGQGGQSWQDPTGGGTSDYRELTNKPGINGVILSGNKSLNDLGIAASSEIPDVSGFYTKPGGGIPYTDLARTVQTSLGLADTAYHKPSGGIPAADIASGVIPDVSGFYIKPNGGIPDADIASSVIWNGKYTKPIGGIPYADIANGVIPDISGKLDSPATSGTSGQVLTSDGNGGQSWTTILPAVTNNDNDKFLRVVNGIWAAATVPTAVGVSF